jgi:hypothetical protein
VEVVSSDPRSYLIQRLEDTLQGQQPKELAMLDSDARRYLPAVDLLRKDPGLNMWLVGEGVSAQGINMSSHPGRVGQFQHSLNHTCPIDSIANSDAPPHHSTYLSYLKPGQQCPTSSTRPRMPSVAMATATIRTTPPQPHRRLTPTPQLDLTTPTWPTVSFDITASGRLC